MSAGEGVNSARRRARRGSNVHRYLFEAVLAIAVYHSICGVYISRGAIPDHKMVKDCEDRIVKPTTGSRRERRQQHAEPDGHPRLPVTAAATGTRTGMDWNVTSNHQYVDIGVPLRGQDDRLFQFAAFLGTSIRNFQKIHGHRSITFRLLVTRYQNEDSTAPFQNMLADKLSLSPDNVVLAPAPDTQFHRAFAINVLHNHTRANTNSILAVVDVDLQVGPHFFVNALNFVSSQTVYFPIVWSQFRPSNVKLVEAVLGPRPEFDQHRGLWRNFGYGIYVLSGKDAKETLMDESFVGWGGEDNDFYARVQAKNMHVVRENDHDLVHVWHPKYCKLGTFVSQKMLQTCQNSRNVMEGSKFGQYLLNVSLTQPPFFDSLLEANWREGKTSMKSVIDMRQSEYAPGQDPADELVPSKPFGRSTAPLARATKQKGAGPRILVAVTVSRRTFATRVAEVVRTWGNESGLPKHVTVQYFVGALEAAKSYESGSDADKSNLALGAGIHDLSSITVLKGVVDETSPVLEKSVAVIKHVSKIIRSSKHGEQGRFEWILMNVHDTTYVNLDALRAFVNLISDSDFMYFGRRADWLPGQKKPCVEGPGVLVSRKTLTRLARHIDNCVQDSENTRSSKIDDGIVEFCLQHETGQSCWEGPDYDKSVFVHNASGAVQFNSDSSISFYPLVEKGSMARYHDNIVKLSTGS